MMIVAKIFTSPDRVYYDVYNSRSEEKTGESVTLYFEKRIEYNKDGRLVLTKTQYAKEVLTLTPEKVGLLNEGGYVQEAVLTAPDYHLYCVCLCKHVDQVMVAQLNKLQEVITTLIGGILTQIKDHGAPSEKTV